MSELLHADPSFVTHSEQSHADAYRASCSMTHSGLLHTSALADDSLTLWGKKLNYLKQTGKSLKILHAGTLAVDVCSKLGEGIYTGQIRLLHAVVQSRHRQISVTKPRRADAGKCPGP